MFAGSDTTSTALSRIFHMLALHPEVTRPMIDKVFSFEEALQAYEYLKSQAHVGKVVIKVA